VSAAGKAAIALAAVTLATMATWGQVAWARRSLPRVWTERVERREVAATITTPGRLLPGHTRTLRALVSGRVRGVLVRAGQRVRTGEPLLVVDSTLLRTELNQTRAAEAVARGQVAADTVAYEIAEIRAAEAARSAGRQERLFALGLTPRAALTLAHHDHRVAMLSAILQRQRVDEAAARARAAMIQSVAAATALTSLTDRSPSDGIIANVLVHEGQWVHAGEPHVIPTPLVTIAGATMAVEASFDQAAAMKVPVGWPAWVVMDAEPMRRWPARVSAVRSGADRDATLRLELLEWPASARVGMNCTVHLTMASRARAIAVPNYALLSLGGTPSVWIITRGAVAVRPVTLGIRGDRYSEVLEGVSAGQRVVTGPHAVLRTVRAGDAVRSSAFVRSHLGGWDEASD